MRGFYAAYGLVRRLNQWAVAAACVCIVLMILLTDWETFTRYFFRQPAMWTHPLASYLLLYSTYLAMGYTLQKGGHVRVEFVVELLPRAAQRWCERLGHLLGLVFTLLFLQQSIRLFTRHLAEGPRDISTLGTPLAWISFGLVVGLALMAVTYVFVLVDAVVRPAGQLTWQEEERARRGDESDLD